MFGITALVAFLIITTIWYASTRFHLNPKHQWCVLVHDLLHDSEYEDDRTKWSTIISDGQTSKRFDGVIANLGNHLVYWQIKTVSKSGSRDNGKFQFRYDIDQLYSTPLGGGVGLLRYGKDLLSGAMENCKFYKSLDGSSDGESSDYEETGLINIKSLYFNSISLEILQNRISSQAAHPGHDKDWYTFDTADGNFSPIDCVQLTPAILNQAKKEFDDDPNNEAYKPAPEEMHQFLRGKLPTWLRKAMFDPAEFDHFLLMPFRGGVSVDFGVPYREESARGSVNEITVERQDGMNNADDNIRLFFVKEHPHLIPWDKVDYYTISPDRTAVVYCQASHIWWQELEGQPKLIGSVTNLRGLQWQPTYLLNTRERQILQM